MAKTGRFDNQAVRLGLLQQHIQPNLQRQAVNTAHAAAGDLFQRGAAVGEQGAVNADLAKLVDQNGPLFIGRFVRQQM